jgi:GTP pyrophosphokinase
MVKVKNSLPRFSNNEINLNQWCLMHCAHFTEEDQLKIRQACTLTEVPAPSATFYGQARFEQGLELAELLLGLQLGPHSVAAAILFCTLEDTQLEKEDIALHLGEDIATLVTDALALSAIDNLQDQSKATPKQIENLRKMLITMVKDVRAVLIKLAERVCIMRGIQIFGPEVRKKYALETFQIYSPLANRLGTYEIKWELEDLSFHDRHPDTYKSIAKALAEKRSDRINRVNTTIETLKEKLHALSITCDITGRAKHIYSIVNKMERKKLDFDKIFDTHAIRVVVPNINDCYQVLSLLHDLWDPIPEEFDDYIATPKPNGYRSIHTAVKDDDNKNLEIQIRTHAMHKENELGVAAHWVYKEGERSKGGIEDKITWLRQLLEWHKALRIEQKDILEQSDPINERIYVFTPQGDIMDLPEKSTPIDLAYYIHSEVGHRCKGAKINGKLLPLTTQLKTGDNVEIVKARDASPSRDWMNSELGYIVTARARSKIMHWFNQHNRGDNLADGKQLFDKECQQQGLRNVNVQQVARKLNFANVDNFYIGLACGHIRPKQISQLVRESEQKTQEVEQKNVVTTKSHKQHRHANDVQALGITHLLTQIANCCKPIPGDPITGYITLGHGVSIHRSDCPNLSKLTAHSRDKIIEVSWEAADTAAYQVDLHIATTNIDILKKQLPTVLASDKIQVKQVTLFNNTKGSDFYTAYAEIIVKDNEQLLKAITKIQAIKEVESVKRLHSGSVS